MSKYHCEMRITKKYIFDVVADDIHDAEANAKRQAAEKLNADEYISGFSIEWKPEWKARIGDSAEIGVEKCGDNDDGRS